MAFLFFVSVISCTGNYCPKTVAWRNQRVLGTGYKYAMTPINYEGDYLLNTGYQYYGTHDWIAESVIEVLYLKANNEFITKLHNNVDDMKWWFLLGTEVPDSNYQVYLLTSCQNLVSNTFVYGKSHKLRFLETSPLTPTGSLLTYVDNVAQIVGESFSWNDCQRAAYYLGALCHLISDATYYPHIYVIPEYDAYKDRQMLDCINFLSDTPYTHRSSIDFFTDSEVLGVFPINFKEMPRQAVIQAGIATRWGSSYYLGAEALHYSFYPDKKFWPIDPSSGILKNPDYKQIQGWTSLTRAQINLDLEAKRYFDSLEHDLNVAIFHSAAAMNNLIHDYYHNCGCTGEQGEDGQMQRVKEPMGDRLDNAQKDENSVELGFFDFMGWFGVVMTLSALKIVKKLNELLKLNPELKLSLEAFPLL